MIQKYRAILSRNISNIILYQLGISSIKCFRKIILSNLKLCNIQQFIIDEVEPLLISQAKQKQNPQNIDKKHFTYFCPMRHHTVTVLFTLISAQGEFLVATQKKPSSYVGGSMVQSLTPKPHFNRSNDVCLFHWKKKCTKRVCIV